MAEKKKTSKDTPEPATIAVRTPLIITLGLTLSVLLLTWIAIRPAIKPTWEYRFETIDARSLEQHLNRFGAKGWHAVAVTPLRGTRAYECVLKRER